MQPISAQPGPQRGQNRHSSCHGRTKLKLASGAIRQLQQVGTVTRDQLLIGCNHRLAGEQRAAYEFFCGSEAADQFDHDVCVGGEDLTEI